MSQQPSDGMPWAMVTVYQPPRGTLIVNVTGYWSEAKARTAQRHTNASEIPQGGQLLACRVRPVLVFAKDDTLIEPGVTVAALDAIDGGEPDADHSAADDIVLAAGPPEVNAAFQRLVDRCAWWATA